MNARVFTLILLTWAATAFAAESRFSMDWKRLDPLPNAAGVAAPFVGVSGGALIVAGGANFPERKPWEGGTKAWHDDVFVLEQPTGRWKRAGQLPRQLAYGVSVTHGDELICVGGSDAQRHYAEVFALSFRNDQLVVRTLPSLPFPVANACGVMLNDTLYITGGIAKPDATNALTNFFALRLNERELIWRELPSWPGTPRMLAMAAVQDNALFIVGGVELVQTNSGASARRYLRDAYRFDPERGWRSIAALPFALAAAPSPAPLAMNAGFFILGGDDGSRAAIAPSSTHPGFNDQVLFYDTKRDAWSRVGTAPAPRVTVPNVLWRDHWIVPSGEMRPGVRSPEIWSLKIRDEK
ncbi:MAG TPA: hypothetical protein VK530_11260 [Candidatus Acidoferrum sp.]|nr:hypothetical protein [Candidatus Acidoferrum sp.]